MYKRTSQTDSGTRIVRILCAAVSCLFSFVYLYCYQADSLAILQHTLSKGVTRYDPLMGAVIITAVLQCVQIATFALVRLERDFHAFTYLPSLLLLTMLTDVGITDDGAVLSSHWWWIAPLALLVWGSLTVAFRQMQQLKNASRGRSAISFSVVWHNLLVLSLMFLLVGLKADGDDVFHYRARMERCLMNGETDKALSAGRKSEATTPALTALRMYALAKKGELAEKLFTYPVSGYVVPVDQSSPYTEGFMIYPLDSLHVLLGAYPAAGMTQDQYMRALFQQNLASSAAVDYRLCAHLIDRDLHAFVRDLPEYYAVNDSLPRHYAEAVSLYVQTLPDSSYILSDTSHIYNKVKIADENLYRRYYERGGAGVKDTRP